MCRACSSERCPVGISTLDAGPSRLLEGARSRKVAGAADGSAVTTRKRRRLAGPGSEPVVSRSETPLPRPARRGSPHRAPLPRTPRTGSRHRRYPACATAVRGLPARPAEGAGAARGPVAGGPPDRSAEDGHRARRHVSCRRDADLDRMSLCRSWTPSPIRSCSWRRSGQIGHAPTHVSSPKGSRSRDRVMDAARSSAPSSCCGTGGGLPALLATLMR